MKPNNRKPMLAVMALLIGLCAIPAAALIHWAIGAIFLALPIFLIYKAG